VDRAADYVQQRDAVAMAGDARAYPYRHPLQTLAASAFVGFLIGRMIAPKRRQRERNWQERMRFVSNEMALIASEAFEDGRSSAKVAFKQGRENAKTAIQQGRAGASAAFQQGRTSASEAIGEGRQRWKKVRRPQSPMWKRAIRLGR
jgi:hypothetical protein